MGYTAVPEGELITSCSVPGRAVMSWVGGGGGGGGGK